MPVRQGTRGRLACLHSRKQKDGIRSKGGEAIAVIANAGQEEHVERIAREAISHFGGFDSWINDAGVSIYGACVDVSIADMKRMFDTNFWDVVYGSRVAVEHLRTRGGGAMINVGSVFSDFATPVQSTYSASKHAVKGWTDALRMELEADGVPVSVTLVKPGRIDTPYNEHARSYMPRQPAHRGVVYPPEAVAQGILYCAAHPKRDMFIGSQSKLVSLGGALAPRLMDKLMEKTMFRSQQADRPSRDREDNALYQAGYGPQENGTHSGWFRSTSFYTQASMHPVLTSTLAAGGAAAALAGLFLPRRQTGR